MRGARSPGGQLSAGDVLLLQRTLGNRLSSRLLAPAPERHLRRAPGPPGVIRRRRGDALIVKDDNTEVRKTKSIRAEKYQEKLQKRTLGVEMGGRTEQWVKLKVVGLPAQDKRALVGLQGWIKPAEADVETGTIDPSAPVEEAPDQYAALGGTLFGEEGPSPDDIQQGGLGDCWLLSPMGAIADTSDGKALLRTMITETADSYRVRFYFYAGGEQFTPKTITISKQFPLTTGGQPIYASNKGGLWPLVIEKAYAEAKGGYFNLGGGSQQNAYAVMTGKFPQGYSLDKTTREEHVAHVEKPAELLGTLMKAKADNQPVTARIPKFTMQESPLFMRLDPDDDGQVLYFGVISREPSGRVGINVAYDMSGKKITRNGVTNSKAQLDYRSIDNSGHTVWTIEFKPEPGEKRETFSAQVSYFTSDLGVDGLVGNHAYMVHAVDEKAETVDLIDPHHSDDLITIDSGDIAQYNITFFVGTLPKAED